MGVKKTFRKGKMAAARQLPKRFLAVEEPDKGFLERRKLPRADLFKMEGGSGWFKVIKHAIEACDL